MKHLLLLVTIVVVYNISLQAQVTTSAKVPVTTMISKPAALNMKAYKLTPAYAQRQKLYSPTFTNPSKVFAMDNNCKLHITFQKNPFLCWHVQRQISDNKIAGRPCARKYPCQRMGPASRAHVTINAQSTNFGIADYSLQGPRTSTPALFTPSIILRMDGSFTTAGGHPQPDCYFYRQPAISTATTMCR